MQKNEMRPMLLLGLLPCTKINCKCIKNLNVKPGTLKLPEENRDIAIHDKEVGKELLSKTPLAQELRTAIDK